MNPTPPHSESAERALLAGLIREPQLVTEACLHHGVRGTDLYFHAHRLVWDAVWSLVESGAVPDLVSVWQTLVCRRETRELDPVCPALWLADLYDEDPTGAWCDWACGEIVQCAQDRAEIHSAMEFLKNKAAGRKVPDVFAMR